jgi:gliding motility-associated-like protein
VTALDTLIWTTSVAGALSCTGYPCVEQQLVVTESIEVWLIAVDTNGCASTDRVLLNLVDEPAVFVPNVFAPESASGNHRFTVFANDQVAEIVTLQIFDRWGGQVFVRDNFPANDPLYGWDGTHRGGLLNPGVFVYWTKVRFNDGSERVLKGDVTLLR